MRRSWRLRAIALWTIVLAGLVGQGVMAGPALATECVPVRNVDICVNVGLDPQGQPYASVSVQEAGQRVVLLSTSFNEAEDGSQILGVVLRIEGVEVNVFIYLTGELDATGVCIYDGGITHPSLARCDRLSDHIELGR